MKKTIFALLAFPLLFFSCQQINESIDPPGIEPPIEPPLVYTHIKVSATQVAPTSQLRFELVTDMFNMDGFRWDVYYTPPQSLLLEHISSYQSSHVISVPFPDTGQYRVSAIDARGKTHTVTIVVKEGYPHYFELA